MKKYQEEFIQFLLEAGALRFGDFTLKSGRHSPFFMNAGSFQTGGRLNRLGEFYAHAIKEAFGTDFDLLFGPAYKGIPLSAACVMAFSRLYGKEIAYCSNRKEIKDHGDTGIFLGGKPGPRDRVVIIEDVTTSGKSIQETFPVLKEAGDPQILGMMVMLDREERGLKTENSALKEITEEYGFPAKAIVSMSQVVEYLEREGFPDGSPLTEEMKKRIRDYYREYGAKAPGKITDPS